MTRRILFIGLSLPFLIVLIYLVARNPKNTGEVTKLPPPSQNENTVTIPAIQKEDVIRTFFSLVNEDKIPEAVEMLSPTAVKDDSQKQAWGVQFNAFESVKVTDIVREEESFYKILLDVNMKPESASAVIPFYGFEDGENVRWIKLDQVNGLWKISSIATGR